MKSRDERSYTPNDVTRALEAYVRLGSFAAAAQEQDIPVKTVESWGKHPKHSAELAEIRREHSRACADYRAALVAKAWLYASRAFDTLRDLEANALKEETRVAACRALFDGTRTLDGAARLDAGMPTSIVGTDTRDDATLIREIESWMADPETHALLGKVKRVDP